MKYKIKPTAKFQKDLKRAKRRGYDLSLLTEIIKNSPTENHCQRKTRIMACPGTIWDAENVTSHQIGC